MTKIEHYIEDPKLFKAVSFACALRKKGLSVPLAVSRAAKYYKVSQKEVAYNMGKIGGQYNQRENVWKNYKKGKQNSQKNILNKKNNNTEEQKLILEKLKKYGNIVVVVSKNSMRRYQSLPLETHSSDLKKQSE